MKVFRAGMNTTGGFHWDLTKTDNIASLTALILKKAELLAQVR